MRKMKLIGADVTVNIVEFFMVSGLMWEYFVTDRKYKDPDYAQAVVAGHEVEMGDIYFPEMKGTIMAKTKNLNECMPAPGWEWID